MNDAARKAKEKFEESLRRIPGVTGVGYNSSVIVYVKEYTPQLAQFIPKKLDDVPVKVVKGRFALLSLPIVKAIYGARTDRYRPAPAGVSMGSIYTTAGTLSYAKERKTGNLIGLSNNHVSGPRWGESQIAVPGETPQLQPGRFDGGVKDGFGVLRDIVPVDLPPKRNLVDAGTFDSPYLKEEILEIGEPAEIIDPKVGMRIQKSGARSGHTFSKLIDVNAVIDVEGHGVCLFEDIAVAQPALGIPGDSGSTVLDENNRVIGLLFAGSPEVTAICKSTNIAKLLDIEILPLLPYISPLALTSLVPMFAVGSALSKGWYR